jgi:hypothetical protein
MKVHAPYYADKTTITVGKEIVEVKAFQIIVWVSVSLRSIFEWDAKIPRFPAILDIGNTHNFAITQDHLQRWAGIHPQNLGMLRRIREKKQLVPLRAASLWLHGDEPFRMSVDEGVAVYEQGGHRLPILGLRALTNSKLQTLIYGEQQRAVIQTPRKWYWPL